MMHNIEFVDGKIEKRVIELYFFRQCLMHLIKFLIWAREYRDSFLSEQGSRDV